MSLIFYKFKKAQKVYGKPTHNKKEKQRNYGPMSGNIYVYYLAQTIAPRTGFHRRESVNHVGTDRQASSLRIGLRSALRSAQNHRMMRPSS